MTGLRCAEQGVMRFNACKILTRNRHPTFSESVTALGGGSKRLHKTSRPFSTLSPRYGVVRNSLGEDHFVKEDRATHQDHSRKLILYSKPGCCLCDGLKEKLHLAFLVGGEHDISDVELEVRDITTKEEWEQAYQYEIPVLACMKGNGIEEVIPRFSPRLTIEQLQKKLAAVLPNAVPL